MARTFSEKIEHIRYLWRGTGAVETVKKLARTIASPFFKVDTVRIVIRYRDLKSRTNPSYKAAVESGLTASVIESVEGLETLSGADPEDDVIPQLREFLEGGTDRIVIPGCLHRPDGSGYELVGFFAIDRGHFAFWEGKLRGPLPPDCMYIANTYTVPKHRGKKVHFAMRQAVDAYCIENQIPKALGFVHENNAPSLSAHKKASQGSVVAQTGSMRRLTILGGLYENISPVQVVLDIINAPIPTIDSETT